MLIVPPQASERASLASFTNTPNLDEHFTFAVLFFSDNTWEDLLNQIAQGSPRKAPDAVADLSVKADPILQGTSKQVNTRIIASLLDAHAPDKGFVYTTVGGRTLGAFDILYEPKSFEPITVGKLTNDKQNVTRFRPWTAYRPRQMPPYVRPGVAISNYRITTAINPDLSIAATADFEYRAPPDSGRVIPLSLSRRMRVSAATLDGLPVETLANYDPGVDASDLDGEFLLIAPDPLQTGRPFKVQVSYSGTVIRQVAGSSYFVSERNLWYPHTDSMSTTFDLTFSCPERFEVVSTGEPVSEQVTDGERTVHRATSITEQLAGFNVGDYKLRTVDSAPYRIETYADKSAADAMNGIPQESANILQAYTQRWLPLPIHNVALTPIPGKFGQGFPGMIYLARLAYVPEPDRPPDARQPREHAFFSEMLLPHELAHQWWGNMITAADYRSDWLMEAMANYSALEYVGHTNGQAAMDSILQQYREDLGTEVEGKPVASIGPVDFGSRLLSASNAFTWQIIVYEKGTWVLHMLRKKLGDQSFRELQLALLRNYSGKPITNQEFQKLASTFVPAGQPDQALTTFFDAWVYGTGIPVIRMTRPGTTLDVSGVDDGFAADLPMVCKAKEGPDQARWQRVVSGPNSVPSGRNIAACRLPDPLDFLYFAK